MPLEVAIYQVPNHRRSRLVCEAMGAGIRKLGDKIWTTTSLAYQRYDTKPIAIFYGMVPPLNHALADARKDGRKAVYIDLGYWGRHEGGRYRGHHKLCINGRHPTSYFQNRPHDDRRAKALGIKVEPWHEGGRHILLAGMSGKSSAVDGFQPNEWERRTIAELKAVTDRPIIYRPKPSWKSAIPLEGTRYSPKDQPLEEVLANCHAVVTHHSNVAVEAIVAGVPAFCWDGVAVPMSLQSLDDIDSPICPEARQSWVNDICYTQWSIAEMAEGKPWKHLRDEGLIG